MPRGRFKLLLDRLAFPLLAVISNDRARRLGLTPIDDERALACLPHCQGLLLDVGCGPNQLVGLYGRGAGVDVFRWPNVDVLCDTQRLPFPDATFDTAALMAVLNHIERPDRDAVLGEVRRVLRPGGRLLVTMIDPRVGRFVHWLRRSHDPDQMVRGMHHDEDPGLWTSDVRGLLERNGFSVEERRRFVYGLNNLYLAQRR